MISTDIINSLESLKTRGVGNLELIQSALIPSFVDTKWKEVNTYTVDNISKANLTPATTTILRIENLQFLIPIAKKNLFTINPMVEMVESKVHPFLLFMDNLFVKWSDIRILRDIKYSYLFIDNHESNSCTNVNILHLPFSVNYNENGITIGSNTLLFKFDTAGLLSATGSTIITTDNKLIVCQDFDMTSGVVSDNALAIDDKWKLSTSNFISFVDNKLYTKLDGTMKNLNILVLNNSPANLLCKLFYNKSSNEDVSNITIFDNATYLKNIIENTVTNTRLDSVSLNNNFDFTHDINLSYADNISNDLNYVSKYNPKLIDDIYVNRSGVITKTYTGAEINALINTNKNLRMLRLKYDGKETFAMIFVNGMLYSKYYTIQYDLSSFTVLMDVIDDKDIVDFIYFKNVNNTIIDTVFIDPTYTCIDPDIIDPFNELIILSQYTEASVYNMPPKSSTLYNVAFAASTSNYIALADEYYYGKALILTTKNQFRYFYEFITEIGNYIILSSDFQTCLESNKYLLFINGKFISTNMYTLLIESETNPFTDPCIYTRIALNPDDIVEVFYLPLELNYLNIGGNIVTEAFNVLAIVDNQSTFTIPYPYTGYADSDNSFMIIVGSLFVDPSRYIILNGTIQFIDPSDYVAFEREVIFVFMYYKDDPVMGAITNTSTNLVTKTVLATVDNQASFDVPIEGEYGFFIIVNSVFIDPNRYTIVDNVLTFIDPSDYIELGLSVNFIFPNSTGEANSITVSAIAIVAVLNNQSSFSIPSNDSTNFFVIVNSTFIDRSRYKVINNNIIFIDTLDYIPIGETVLFVFADYFNTSEDVYVTLNSKSVMCTRAYQSSFDIPSLGLATTYSEDSFILIKNTIFVDPSRYDVIGSTIQFTDELDYGDVDDVILFVFAEISSQQIIYPTRDLGDKANVEINTVSVIATTNNQSVFIIPYIGEDIHSSFFINIRGTFIDSSRYVIVDNTISFIGLNISLGCPVIFTFVHNNDIAVIHNQCNNVVAISDSQILFNIPTPFPNYLDLNNRFILLLGSVFIEESRYLIDNASNTIKFTDPSIKIIAGDFVSFMFFYTSSSINGIPAEIPPAGYVYINKDSIKSNLSKYVCMFFVNGNKLNYNDIEIMSNNMIRIKNDIKSRFNLCILSFAPIIDEFTTLISTYSDWDLIINKLNISDMNTLTNINTNISDTTPRIIQNITEATVRADIVRDYWMSNNINKGSSFIYDYESKISNKVDTAGNFLVETSDAMLINSMKTDIG